MSSLSYICGYGYGSNSDDSDCEFVNPEVLRKKLPTPDLSKVPVVPKEVHIDDPEDHGGRIRSFPHVRGNWPTFVYVKLPDEENIIKLVDKLQRIVLCIDQCFEKCDDLHISLSRTITLQYHQIKSFTTSLQKLQGVESFKLAFDSIKVYCNEENTRTFIALKVDHLSHKYLSQITKEVDEILVDFKLPTFYEDPSFHMSILWVNLNKKAEVINILDNLNDIVRQEIGKTLTTIPIQKINCKSGNKHFQYCLK